MPGPPKNGRLAPCRPNGAKGRNPCQPVVPENPCQPVVPENPKPEPPPGEKGPRCAIAWNEGTRDVRITAATRVFTALLPSSGTLRPVRSHTPFGLFPTADGIAGRTRWSLPPREGARCLRLSVARGLDATGIAGRGRTLKGAHTNCPAGMMIVAVRKIYEKRSGARGNRKRKTHPAALIQPVPQKKGAAIRGNRPGHPPLSQLALVSNQSHVDMAFSPTVCRNIPPLPRRKLNARRVAERRTVLRMLIYL